MLRRDEWPYWPLAPWLAWQGWRAVRGVPRLAPASTPAGRVAGPAPTIRLLGLGDSTIAGVGCEQHETALTGAVAARLASVTGRAVEWRARGVSGATAADVRRALLAGALDGQPDVVVLSVGVNDAVRGRSPDAFAADLVAIVEALAAGAPSRRTVFAGVAPIGSFPALAAPLATLLARRALRLQAAACASLGERVPCVSFPASLPREAFAADGFHPGPAGCSAWSSWIVSALERTPGRDRA